MHSVPPHSWGYFLSLGYPPSSSLLLLSPSMLQELLPLVLSFELPAIMQSDPGSPTVQHISQTYNLTVSFKPPTRLYRATGVVRGSQNNANAVKVSSCWTVAWHGDACSLCFSVGALKWTRTVLHRFVSVKPTCFTVWLSFTYTLSWQQQLTLV